MDENNINNGFPILVENNLVVSELSKPGFKVYPNPSQGHLTVEGNGLLTVFNILGQKVLSGNIDGITSIELPKGMYFMTLGNSTQKVIVE